MTTPTAPLHLQELTVEMERLSVVLRDLFAEAGRVVLELKMAHSYPSGASEVAVIKTELHRFRSTIANMAARQTSLGTDLNELESDMRRRFDKVSAERDTPGYGKETRSLGGYSSQLGYSPEGSGVAGTDDAMGGS